MRSAAPEELAETSTDSLTSRLTGLLARTASDLAEMAAIVGELDRRGVDLTGLRIGLIGYLRRIAAGSLAPEAVVRFASNPRLLDRVATLPIDTQRSLASGQTVALAVFRGESVDSRQFDPLGLTEQQQRQVFAPGEIRAVDKQIPLLTQAAQQDRTRRKASIKTARVTVDPQTREIRINRTVIPHGELLQAIRQISDPTPQGDEPTVPVQVKLTEEQHRRLKVHCAKYDSTIGETIITSLASAGVFRNPF